MYSYTIKKSAARIITASSLFASASLASTGCARSFELTRNPEVPTCTNFANRGRLVELPGGQGVATDGNCNPAAPMNHYTAWALNNRVIRITGEKTCDFVLQSDGVHLTRQRCWPNAQP